MILGIIFDLDGVLCHTDEYHYQAWKSIARELNIPFDRTVNNRLRGISRKESLEIILSNARLTLTKNEKQRLAERKNSRYQNALQGMTPADLSDEVKTTLKLLRAKGYRMAVGSSSKNAGLILEKLGITGCFDAIVDGCLCANSKPQPDIFLKAAELLNLSPQECVVVEDALAGIQAANRGGFKSIGIGDEASNLGATSTISSINELLVVLKLL